MASLRLQQESSKLSVVTGLIADVLCSLFVSLCNRLNIAESET